MILLSEFTLLLALSCLLTVNTAPIRFKRQPIDPTKIENNLQGNEFIPPRLHIENLSHSTTPAPRVCYFRQPRFSQYEKHQRSPQAVVTTGCTSNNMKAYVNFLCEIRLQFTD